MADRYTFGIYLALVYALILSISILMPLSTSKKVWIFRIVLFSLLPIILILVTKYTWTLLSSIMDKITKVSVRLIMKLLLGLILFLANCAILFFNVLFEADAPIFATICLTCMAFYIQFLTSYWSIRLFQIPVLFVISKYLYPNQPHQWSSYKTLPILISATASFILTVYGITQAAMLPEVKNVEIKLTNLPKSFDGFNIVMLSDIHLGITISKDHLDKIAHIVSDLNADILVLVGDLTDVSVSNGKYMSESLNNFKAKHGKYFVTGNHEYYTNDFENWLKHLSTDLNFIVLSNSHVKIFDNRKEDFLYLAGVDDIEASRFGLEGMNLNKALNLCQVGHPIILLAHQPKAAKIALNSNFNISLVLSGHTHGGQMFPMSIMIYLMNPFYRGLYTYGSGQVYVTQGTYYWGFPLRTFSQSEITLITLHSA